MAAGNETRASSGRAGNICIQNPWPGIFQTIWKDPDRFVQQYYARYCKDRTSRDWRNWPYMALAGRSSLVLNAISITRAGENDKMPIHEKIALAKPPKGPVRQIGLEHVMDCYVIWKFAENIDGAKTFLVDYVDNFKQAFLASEFYNFPCFSKTVPDLAQNHRQGYPRRCRRTSTRC